MKNRDEKISLIVFVIAICIPIFTSLSVLPIRDFDEARNSINALEMANDHNYIVTHFNGYPDMWNTKPPLLIWTQVTFIKLLGENELAIRLPSAIAAFLTCISILFFFIHCEKNFWLGLLSVLVLVTSEGYIDFHSSRTGDYDAMLTLFLIAYCFSFYLYTQRHDSKYLHAFFAFLFLATFTKGVQGLLFLPAIAIYSLTEKKLKQILCTKAFYVGTFAFLSGILGYYLLRNHLNPGFISSVFQNELGGRYLNVIEHHFGGFWYYTDYIQQIQLKFYYLLVPCGVALGIFERNQKLRKLSTYLTICSVTYFLIISLSKTKCYWYDIPLFPFLSFFIALCFYKLMEIYKSPSLKNHKLPISIISILIVCLLFYEPVRTIFKKTVNPVEHKWDKEKYEIGHFLQDAVKGKHNLNNYTLIHEGYSTQNLFYLNILNKRGINISLKSITQLTSGEKIIVHQKDQKKILNELYYVKVDSSLNNIELLTIDSIR